MRDGRETTRRLLLPPLATAGLTVLAGLLATTEFSPLAWVYIVASREYLTWSP